MKVATEETIFLARLAWWGAMGITRLASDRDVRHNLGSVAALMISSKYRPVLSLIYHFVTRIALQSNKEDNELQTLPELETRGEKRRTKER